MIDHRPDLPDQAARPLPALQAVTLPLREMVTAALDRTLREMLPDSYVGLSTGSGERPLTVWLNQPADASRAEVVHALVDKHVADVATGQIKEPSEPTPAELLIELRTLVSRAEQIVGQLALIKPPEAGAVG